MNPYFNFNSFLIFCFLYSSSCFSQVQWKEENGQIKTKKEIGCLFILGAGTFTLFELIGPQVMLAALLLSFAYYFIANKKEAFNTK